MSVPGQEISLRPRRFEYKRLGWALLISLFLHLCGYGGYQFSRHVLPVWLARIKFLSSLAHELQPRKQNPPPPPQPTSVPLVFVEVNPQAATPEAPKNAKYYSSQNSKAADQKSTLDTDTPKIEGEQDKIVKTEDAPRKFTSLQPSPAPQQQKAEKAKENKPAEQAKPKPTIGDLAMAKPSTELEKPDKGIEEHTRPRTIAEAMMRRQNNNLMPGQKMRQEGGVQHHLDFSAVDARATGFGEYDRAFIEAVEEHWFSLLDDRNYAYDRTGKVILQFKLNYDGRVTDMTIAQTTVGQTLAYLCELAVLDNAPYERWPSDMRHELGDSRNIQFTFYY